MLKIKDNVDLKELEKFGFKFEKEHGLFSDRYIIYFDCDQTIQISKSNRKIYTEDISGSYSFGAIVDEALTILYDLIQAGLVEKIDN